VRPTHPELVGVLDRARRAGLLGPAPVTDHIRHSGVFLALDDPSARALDLGSGAGIPGLVLALAWPDSRWVLLDAGERRVAHLRDAVTELALADRVEVRLQRAEVAGRDPGLRAGFDLVVARGFGPPPVTAECASPFLRVGGRLAVSEPPDDPEDRWDEAGLGQLGLRRGPLLAEPGASVQVLEQVAPCPDRFPRRVGIPAKRPLW
jgi:16S rRNA (guanine527-N7)-methyltransferase